MAKMIENRFIGIIQFHQQGMLSSTEDLTNEQITQQPSPTAPPIGWHLFHIARWADRLQASFSIKSSELEQPSHLPSEIWTVEGLAKQWGLNPERLGLLETGAGMAVDEVVIVASLGKSILLEYARRTFSEVEQAVRELTVEQLEHPRQSILPEIQVSSTGQPYFSGKRNVVILNDLIFHISHTGRHLGMVEALRGAMFAIPGTASV